VSPDQKSSFHPTLDQYRYSVAEKLGLFWPCLRQKIHPARNLLAGPFAGEFGYELMQWQGFVRARRPLYEEVHVLTYPGRDYLYEGCQVHHHGIDLKKAGYWYGRISPAEARQMAVAKAAEIGLTDYDIFDTSLLCTKHHKRLFWRQEFRLLEEPPVNPSPYDVVFHFRNVRKEGSDAQKNYAVALADELVQSCRAAGLTAACIGHPDYSYCPADCPDHRSVDLRQTVAAISTGRLVVGENSGPMHLANLCGKPTVIWAQHQWRVNYSLRWNPFQVPIYVAANDTCQPEPARVCGAIQDALAGLRSRTDQFSRPCYTLPSRPIANF
jgi:hypothetical protein